MSVLKPTFGSLLVLLLVLVVLTANTNAFEPQSHSSKPTLEIGISFAIPPWVITETRSGIELDILNAALAYSGYKVKPNFLSFALAYSLFESGKLDGVINVKENSLKTGFLSDTVVAFDNVAISLAEKNYPAHFEMDFLADKSVIAFQNAAKLLGDDYKAMSQKNPQYQEVSKQSLQINLLLIRNIDFVVMDTSIFGYYRKEALESPELVQAKAKLTRPVTFHRIFEPNEYRFAFNSEQVRDDFNAGLAALRKNGSYDEIIKKYAHLINLYEEKSLLKE